MIQGRFGANRRPFVEAELWLPRLGVRFSVTFLVDTGADTTSLAPRDWTQAGLRTGDFAEPAVRMAGVSGVIECPEEQATLRLIHADAGEDEWPVSIEVLPLTAAGRALPSILGRDIIRRYRLFMSIEEQILTLGPL